jgi:hypothetical protein
MNSAKILLLLFFLTGRMLLFAQLKTLPKRYIQKVFMDTTEISKPQFLVYPVLAYSPETSWELGLSALYVRYAKGDTTNRLSEINAFTFYTLENQYGGFFEHAIYSDKNKWFFLGKMKFQSFPLSYYGIGPSTPYVNLAKVEAMQFQIKERVLHKIHNNIYGGLEFDFHHLGRVQFVDKVESSSYTKPLGSDGSTNFGMGMGLLYDNRHNVLNVREGLFAEAAFIHYNPSYGSDFNFTSFFGDFRYFHPIKHKNVLAFQAISQFTFGDAPFNQLALMGGEMMMRGYYTGRYRDKNLIATQLEYRMLPIAGLKRFGASAFVSTGVVSPRLNVTKINQLVVSGGAGLRFLLFPKKDVWTRLDFAFTGDKLSPGIYLYIGEAF